MNSTTFKTIRTWTAIIVLSCAATFSFATWILAADVYSADDGRTLSVDRLETQGFGPD